MRSRSTSAEPIGAALTAEGPTSVGERSLFGLTQAEAAARLSAIGPNRIVAKERLAWFKRLMALLADPMAIMLGGASVLYFLLGDTTDGIIMAAALAPVLGVDVFLEARSSAALAKLAQALRPLAHVIRDGAPKTVPTEALVPGDLLALEEGDVVHADGVVREASNLALDESSLTGESEPQAKHASLGTDAPEERQQVFAGSLVLAGKGSVEVVCTGPKTRFGHIAQLMVVASAAKTPLQRRTGKLVRWLSVVALVVATAVSALELLRGQSWQHALLIAISLAMAAIPEEYPLVLTLFLSVGAFRLGKLGVLVRRLASVETLGSTTVICTDKTGTLTAGTFVLDETVCLTPALSQATLLELAVLACEPAPVDPMERAIDHYAAAHGVDPLAVRTAWQLAEDNDFDAVGKHMSHGYRSADGTRARVAAKGALEGILEHCTVTPEERKRAEAENARLAGAGMRVLALAMKEGASLSGTRATDEADLTLVGLLGYRDPLRPEVPAAVAECRAAGIDLKMITGDHALTARAIAEAAGFARAEAVVTGAELEKLEPEAFAQKVRDAALFARISPAQKHAIVAALKASGEVVAMTGDGINDAPALRLSDIGISMGKRGTEVARASSDLVLLDDNFASIVATVREGRHIFHNLQAAFLYILAFHVPVVSLAFLAPALGMPPLLMPVHLVWLELIIHPVSAVVFQTEPAPAGLMLAPPRPPKAPLLPRAAALRSVLAGLTLTFAVTWLYVARQGQGEVAARSLAWATLLLGYQVLVLVEWGALRGKGSTVLPHKPVVWALWSVCGASLPVAMAIGPLARALRLQQLSLRDWGVALGVALAATAWRAPLDRFRPVRPERRRPPIALGGASGSLVAVSLCLLSAVGCGHPITASGGPPKNAAAPSAGCIGDAPLDEEVQQVQFIEGAGHVPMRDQPELFASLVSGYLDSPAPPKHSPKPPNASTRVGRCEGQENLILEGDYARIEVHDCKHIWLNRVRAKQILIKDSEGRIDNSEVSAGMTVEKSELALTGGELRGHVALEASESKLDIAGVEIVGDALAVRIREKSDIVFSVTPLKSPKNDRIFHGGAAYDAGSEL